MERLPTREFAQDRLVEPSVLGTPEHVIPPLMASRDRNRQPTGRFYIDPLPTFKVIFFGLDAHGQRSANAMSLLAPCA
jgi:hypothetical protein